MSPQAAIDWALARVPPSTRARYETYGQKLLVGPDVGTCAAGPCWIWDALKFNKDADNNIVTIQGAHRSTPASIFLLVDDESMIFFTICIFVCQAFGSGRRTTISTHVGKGRHSRAQRVRDKRAPARECSLFACLM